MEKYLHKCLDSLIIDDEGMKQLEVLVINDGSKDSSSQIAHGYQDKYPDTFRVIDKENGNYGSCINCGLKEATGKYVKVLDADDSFENKNVDSFLRLLSKVDTDMILSGVCTVNEQNAITGVIKRIINTDKVHKFGDLYNTLLTPFVQMHEVTYKRENLIKTNYRQEEGISYTDQQWMHIPMLSVNTICFFNEIIYRYLVGREGQTVNMNVAAKSMPQKLKITKILIETANENRCCDEYHFNYLKKRILENAKENYKYVLCISQNVLLLKQLVEIDETLKLYFPEIWNELETLTVPHTNFRYVHYWHGHKNLIGYPFLLIIINKIFRIIHHL